MPRLAPFIFSCLLLSLASMSLAQEMREEATPFSVWLDFQRLAANRWQRTGPPAWLESVGRESKRSPNGTAITVFRLRFDQLRELENELQLRLFFDDQPDAAPKVSGWTETGTMRFESEALGNQLELPTSEAFNFPTRGIDYVEITVPGDGRNIRGVFLTTLETLPVHHALDFALSSDTIDAFGNAPPAVTSADDLALFGRVKATLDLGITKLTPPQEPSATWEFILESPPQLAVVSFEVLNADALAPLEVSVNGQASGPAQIQLPDLADPGYLASTRPLSDGPHFRYTGWLRCQKAIPASRLRAGKNQIVLQLPPEAGAVAVRSVELQLKHPSKKLESQSTSPLP